MCGHSSAVERYLAKVEVVGSIPTARSNYMRIDEQVLHSMSQHALESFPEEACGFIVRKEDKTIDSIRAANASYSETEYSINPIEYSKVEKNNDIIGIYHSHTNGRAYFSEKDKEHAWNGLFYVVLGVTENEVTETVCYKDGKQIFILR